MCRDCPLQASRCPGRARRQVNFGEHEDLLIVARQALANPATGEHLRQS
jgi:hypothetical protein